jgi:trigger factor
VKVTREKIENSQAFLTIEMEPAEVERSLDEAYRRLAKKTNIPGFRKGKAPREILERYLGKESFMEDALSHLVPQAYEQALKEQQLEAIAQPHIELIQTDPVIFKAIVPLMPVVKLGDYHQIQVAPEPVEVTDDRVDAVIERLRHQNATWEPVERATDFGDLLVLEIESQVEGKPFINQKGAQYQLVRDSAYPVPGFGEQLVGMKKGEEKEFKLELPADFPEELREKEASFKVKVVEIKEEILPELNDEFASQLGPELKTVAALKEEVASNLRRRAEEQARMDFEEKVIDAVVDQAQVEFPPVLVEMEIHRLIDEQSRRFQMQGGSLEEYLKSANKTEEQLHEELYPLATKRVTRSLVLGKVAEEEKIEVDESEIDAEIERMISNAGERKNELRRALGSPRSRQSIRQILLTRKTINRLVEIAKEANTNAGASKEEEK